VRKIHSLSLSAKLGVLGILLFGVALASIGITLWVGWQLQGGASAINEAGRLRMQTWRLAQALSAPQPDRQQERARVAGLLKQYQASLDLLQNGDPVRPLFVPRDARSQQALRQVRQGWQTLRARWSDANPPVPGELAAQAEHFVGDIDTFVSSIERQIEKWTTLLNTFQFVITGAVIASGISLIYAAWTLVLNPLARLQDGVERIRKGDLAARVEVRFDDEFGMLARDFNLMAETLQDFYRDLEARVDEKTLSLQVERERLAQLYQAVSLAVSAASLDELADGYARQLRRVAGADACVLRWADESGSNYLLLASDGLPAELAKTQYSIPVGQCPCGQNQTPVASAQTSARAISVTTARVTPLPMTRPCICEQAGFQSMVSVPIQQHERRVGGIDLFYRNQHALGDEDRALLEALANHLASAVESLRVEALEREAAVAEERGLLARELHDSIAQNLSFQKIQASLLREAIARADTPAIGRTLDELDTGIRESLADVRELLVHFRTRANAQDTVLALRTALTKFEHQTGLRTELTVQGQGLPLPADMQVQMLHVVQEALSNVRKHAKASRVSVEVERGLQQWRLEVCDDGCGFDAARMTDDETHVGLRIMRERALRIGATVDVTSVPGAGTCVVLNLPQHAATAADTPPARGVESAL
jgi:two-component system nitrate/nitrite sensor histidine kinase NarX